MYKSSIKTEDIVNLYNSGLNQREVAEYFQMSQCGIRGRLIASGIKIRERGNHDYLIGKTFGNLTVLRKSNIKCPYTGIFYDCVCSCDGNITQATPSQLKSGGKKSCGCLNNLIGKNNKGWKGCGELSGSKWCAITSRRKIGRECNISIEYAWELFLQQNRKCALSGIKLQFGKSGKDDTTASLDRIDSSIGYIEGNVQWIHKDIQNMKWDKKEKYFIELCIAIANNQRIKNEEKVFKY